MICTRVQGLMLIGVMCWWGRGTAQTLPADAASRVEIDCAKPQQRIDGFGASLMDGSFRIFERGNFDQAAEGVRYQTTPRQREHLLKLLLRDLRCTHLRIWVWPAVEMENDNDDPQVMNEEAFTWAGNADKPTSKDMMENRRNGLRDWGELLQAIRQAGGVTWIVTPGDLPPWLKKGIEQPPEDVWFEEYAEWAAAQALYLKRTFGMEPPYWTFHNEADHLRQARSREFWKKWIQVTARRFAKEGLGTKLMVPDFMDVHRAVPLVTELLEDPEIRKLVGALAYHHYRSSGDGPQPFLQITKDPATADAGALFDKLTGGAMQMAALAKQCGIPSWQTEAGYYPKNVKPLSEWQVGRGRANEIYYELISGASAIEGMMGIWVDAVDPRVGYTVRHEGHHIVMKAENDKVIGWEVTKDCGVVFAHWARFVEPGDLRVQAACADSMLRVTAFVSKANRRCVAVIVNNEESFKDVEIRLQGIAWPASFSAAVFSDGKQTWRTAQVIQPRAGIQEYKLKILPLSVTTFILASSPVAGPLSRDFLDTPGCREEYKLRDQARPAPAAASSGPGR